VGVSNAERQLEASNRLPTKATTLKFKIRRQRWGLLCAVRCTHAAEQDDGALQTIGYHARTHQ